MKDTLWLPSVSPSELQSRGTRHHGIRDSGHRCCWEGGGKEEGRWSGREEGREGQRTGERWVWGTQTRMKNSGRKTI